MNVFFTTYKKWTYTYLIILIIELIGEGVWQQFDFPYLVYVVKPLLMILLMRMVSWSTASLTPPLKALLIALLFSWLGDVLLMFVPVHEAFFLAGLVSFLSAHIAYIFLFARYTEKQETKSVLLRRPWLPLPFLLFGLGLISFLANMNHPAFAEMKVPVIIYSAVIITMVLAALNRYQRVSINLFRLVFLGAVLFMISDTLIAINKFTYFFEGKEMLSRLLIMLLYAMGQYLIVTGIIRQNESGS